MAPQPPDTSYRKRFPPVREFTPTTDPPASLPSPPGTIQVKAGGTRITLPIVAVMTVLSALGGAIGVKAMPTPSTQDSRLDRIQEQLITADLKSEREREEMRRQSQAQEDRLRLLQTQISSLEAQLTVLQRSQARGSGP